MSALVAGLMAAPSGAGFAASGTGTGDPRPVWADRVDQVQPSAAAPAFTAAAVPQTTQIQLWERAESWMTAWNGGAVPYRSSADPATWFRGYRRDCSGYASMALGLPGPGLVTGELATSRITTPITRSQLRFGDLMINPGVGPAGHVVVFDRWVDANHYLAYEQGGNTDPNGSTGTKHQVIPYPYFGSYSMSPYRYNGLSGGVAGFLAPRTRSDVNGDERDDIAVLYHHYGSWVTLFTMGATTGGGLAAPAVRWEGRTWGPGTRFLDTGDFNGDHRDDVAILYSYGGGTVALFTLSATGGGALGGTVPRWSSRTGGNGLSLLACGDFNGDSRDDVALWYTYGGGSAALYTLTATGGGGFAAPVRRWSGTAYGTGTRYLVAGDFNGDGRDDVGLWNFDGAMRGSLVTLTTTGGGNFAAPVRRWQDSARGDGLRFVEAGDFNGDGRDDVMLFISYGGASVGVSTLTATGGGGFAAPVRRWSGATWGNGTRFASRGDYNGDHRDDIMLWYQYSASYAAVFTLTATGGGALGAPVPRWGRPTWGANTIAAL